MLPASRLVRAGHAVWCVVIALLCLLAPAQAQAVSVVRKVPVASNGGTVSLLSDGTVWFSASGAPTGDLGVPAYAGSQQAVHAVGAGGGVVTLFSGGAIYFSPDGLNLGGGGSTVRAYSGLQSVVRFVGVNGGVDTLFSGGAVYFSPDGRNLGGGGNTERAYAGSQSVTDLREIPGAVRTRFSGGGEYISTTGRNLGGGGSTLRSPVWHPFRASAEFGPRDSGKVLASGGALWLSGGFYRGPSTSYSDLWRSDDEGVTWRLMAGHAEPMDSPAPDHYEPYSPLRPGGTGLVAIGSYVWSSADGSSWAPRVTGPVRATEDTFAFVFNGGYVMIDTYTGTSYTSADGDTWNPGVTIEGFEPRCGAAVAAALGRIWIQGGGKCDYSGFHDDIWSSDDGVHWQRMVDAATGVPLKPAWPTRMWPAVCRDATTMFVIGGFQINGASRTNASDVWYTQDGTTWRPLQTNGSTSGAGPVPRHAANCYVRTDPRRIVLVAGKGGADGDNDRATVRSDVWSLELPATLR